MNALIKRVFAAVSCFLLPAAFVFAQSTEEAHPIMKFFGMGNAPQSTIIPANGIAREINDLYGLLGWIGLFIFLVVAVVAVVVVYRFRESKNPQPIDSHGNTLLEILWTAIPLVILIVIAVPTIRLVFKMGEKPDLTKQDTIQYTTFEGDIKESNRYLEVNVVAHQWWWEFEYVGYHVKETPGVAPTLVKTDKKVTANEMWLPINVPIKFNIISEDVIHSFWVPRLMGKVDALPGVINNMTFVVEKEGYYYGVCAEYCGASHALMRFNIVGVSQDKFDAWSASGNGEMLVSSEAAERGKTAFQTCLGCHTMNGLRAFEPRQARLDRDMALYDDMVETFYEDEKAWREEYLKDKSGHVFFREIKENPGRPTPPVKPRLYQDQYRTIAPDLTDFRYRRRMLASIYENERATLKEWILNPPSMKPEMQNTPVIRMPAYESILDEQTIDDIIEFLMTVEYSDAPSVPSVDDLFNAASERASADFTTKSDEPEMVQN